MCRSSTGTPLRLGSVETSAGALNDHVSLKLGKGKGNHHGEEGFSLPSGA